MKPAANLFVCLALLAGFVIGVASLESAWVANLGCDLWSLAELQQLWERENQRNAELGDLLEIARRRHAEREQLTRALINGHLRLGEAVARFRALNEEDPAFNQAFHSVLQDDSPDCSACLQVLNHAKIWARVHCPERETAVMSRLNEEARSIFRPQ